MKLIQTIVERVNSWLGNDPYNSWWNQKKYQKFADLIPRGDHTFGQFSIYVDHRDVFSVWFNTVELTSTLPTAFGRMYYWNYGGPFQQDFINFVDEYIVRRTAEIKLAKKVRNDDKLAALMLYVPGRVIF